MNSRSRLGLVRRFPTTAELAHALTASADPADDPAQAIVRAWYLRQRTPQAAERLVAQALPRLTADDPRSVAAAGWGQLVLAETRWLAGDHPQAQAHLERAQQLLQSCNCLEGQADALWLQSHLDSDAGRLEARSAAMASSLAHAVQAGDEARVHTARLALACFALYEETAMDASDLELAQALQDSEEPGVRLLARSFLMSWAFHADRAALAIEHAIAGKDAAQACGQLRRLILDGCTVATYLFDIEEVEDAVQQMQGVVEVARACGWPDPLALALATLARALMRLGRLDSALDIVEEAFALVQDRRRSRHFQIVSYTYGLILIERHEPQRAKARFEEMQAFADSSGDVHIKRWAMAGLAQVLEIEGQWAAAYDVAEVALQAAAEVSDATMQVPLYRLQARVSERLQAGTDALAPSRGPAALRSAEELLIAAAEAASRVNSMQGHDELLLDLCRMREQSGDMRGALAAARDAYAALQRLRRSELANRSVGIEVRLRTAKAQADAALQRQAAAAEATRAEELLRLNAKLQAAMTDLQSTQEQLLCRNDELTQAHAAINELSLTDPLTGLRNRRYFDQVVAQCVAEALRPYRTQDPHAPPAREVDHDDLLLFLVDLDHFKQVNDEHGHAAGDAVLTQMGDRLRLVAREVDHVVRWGGEEFLIAMRGTPRRHAAAIAARLLSAVSSSPFVIPGGVALHRTCSIGYCAFPVDVDRPFDGTIETALKAADERLYHAKHGGRNRACGEASVAAHTPTPLPLPWA